MWTDVKKLEDPAQNVMKYVFSSESAVAEAVLYKYPDYATRTVICCSTQSGCPVGCRFCGAGDSFVRSLTAEEIFSQVKRLLDDVRETDGVEASSIGKLQVMFMSMGEPLLNLKNLIPALRMLKDAYPRATLLISTSGPGVDYEPVRAISREIPQIGLQFSIHETTNEARSALIPFKAKLTLQDIALQGALWHYSTGRRPFFNYCAHEKNSSDDDADRILKLFDPKFWCATVSVICERQEGLPATNQVQRDLATGFAQKLVDRGYDVRVFDPAGQDTIGGGCGQLWFVQEWMNDHPDLARPSVGRDMPVVHTPA